MLEIKGKFETHKDFLTELLNNYYSLTEGNNHSAAALILVDYFGTMKEKILISNFCFVSERSTLGLHAEDIMLRDKISNKYFQQLRILVDYFSTFENKLHIKTI